MIPSSLPLLLLSTYILQGESLKVYSQPKYCNSWNRKFHALQSSSLNLDVRHNFQTKLSALTTLRGGSTAEYIEDDDDHDGSALVTTARSVVKTILGFSGPVLGTPLKVFVLMIEGLLQIQLLPKPPTKTKAKKRSSKASKTKKEKVASPTKKKRRKAVSSNSSSPKKPTSSASKKKRIAASPAATAHLKTKLSATNPNYRIQRELRSFIEEPPEGLRVRVGKSLRVWIVEMKGVGIYKSEKFQLRVKFPPSYPAMPPSVYFLPPNIPTHEHVYTNGDICLSLLGKDWRPTMTAQAIVLSIHSILGSAQSRSLPMDNAKHAQNKPGEYQKDWVYHDDSC